MDTIATIVVTAFLNIIITGIVSNFIFYRFQKKIENTFAKSMLEYQARLTRNFPKTLDTLEMLIGKYNIFKESLLQLREFVVRHARDEDTESQEYNDLETNINSALEDMNNYLQRNRHLLPDTTVTEIENIIYCSDTLVELTKFGRYFYKMEIGNFIRMAKKQMRYINLEIEFTKFHDLPTLFLSNYMLPLSDAVEGLSKRLERNYKSL